MSTLSPGLVVVHPHFHFRRTGVTGHVEAIVPALAGRVDARVLGRQLDPRLPRITLAEVFCTSRRAVLIWHAHRNNELLLGLLLRLFRPLLKVVMTRHSASAPGAWTRLLFRRADALIALTPEVAAQVAEPARTVVVGHGVDLARFSPPADRAESFRALGLGRGSFGIGVVGRIRPPKGQGDFAAALAPVWSRHPGWAGVLLGRIKPEDAAWARTILSPEVVHLQEREDAASVYQALTILVQPSHSEGYSLVLLEALASGCCVVAARLPHFPGIIDEGRTGFLYPPGDVEALRTLLDRLMTNPGEAREVGARAALEARARFGVAREAESLLAVYRRLG